MVKLSTSIADRANELLAADESINYRVVESDVQTKFGTATGYKALYGVSPEGQVVGDEPFQLCTKNYTVFDNFYLAALAATLEEQSNGEMKVVRSGALKYGMAHFSLESDQYEDAARGDLYKMRFNILNSHTSQTSLLGFSSGNRLVCTNQLPAIYRAGFETGFRFRHRQDEQTLMDEAKHALKTYGQSVVDTRKWIKRMSGKPVEWATVHEFFKKCFNKRFPLKDDADKKSIDRYWKNLDRALEIMTNTWNAESCEYGNSEWVAVNAATKWLQHNAGRLNSRNREYSNFAGANAGRTRQAFEDWANLVA